MTIYNSVSLDGRVTGFVADLALYYGISAEWGNDGVLVGSGTVLKSMEAIPEDTEDDLHPPETVDDASLPYVLFVDSKGLIRSHHVFRQQPYIREVMVLISKDTPDDYRRYLDDRNYRYIETGDDRVDLISAMEVLYEEFGLRNMRTDSGGTLNSALIDADLVDEIVLILNPVLAGNTQTPLLSELSGVKDLEFRSFEKLDNGSLFIKCGVK